MALDALHDSGPAVCRIIPYLSDELPGEIPRATGRHVRPGPAAVSQPPFEHSPQAYDPRKIEEHYGAGALQTGFHRAPVVAIGDPSLLRGDFLDEGFPLLVGGGDLAWALVEHIEVDHSESRKLSESLSQRQLACACRA